MLDPLTARRVKLLTADMTKLKPFLNNEELAYVQSRLIPLIGKNIKAQFNIDFEQLQIADYSSFFSHLPELANLLRIMQDNGFIAQHELNFLTLRSLITLTWPRPRNTDDLKLMIDVEFQVNFALVDLAQHLTSTRPERIAWVPYWARLANLDLLAELPETLRERYSTDIVPTIVVRSKDVNASTCRVPTAEVIVLDYALEPFLKSMNMFLFSYFATRDMAGPKRFGRALSELIPRVLFIKAAAPAYVLSSASPVIGQETMVQAKAFTDAQIRFLVAHEFAHILLKHPGEHRAFPISQSQDDERIRQVLHEHMYEHEADLFALNWHRSQLLNALRYVTNPKQAKGEYRGAKAIKSLQAGIGTYYNQHESVRTLFLIMNFVEACYERLLLINPDLPKYPTCSHPHPAERWNRLKNHTIVDLPLSSEVTRYSDYLFRGVLDLMDNTAANSIREMIQEAKKSESTNSYTNKSSAE